MKLETFQDVLASIQKNKKRSFHLLLGNGFRMAYDSAIFSYNALHNFIQNEPFAKFAAGQVVLPANLILCS